LQLSDKTKQVFAIALPIIGGMASQNILNLIDTAMVGQLGDKALAGVGMGSFASFASVAFVMGLSASVQAISARRVGEGKINESAFALNGGLVLAAVIGIPMAIGLYLLAPTLFPYLNKDAGVIDVGVSYWQYRLIAVAAVGMNFAFRGYWNAIERSALYMRTLFVMHISNIILDYLLIFGKFGFPKMGAPGAGLATAIAMFIGVAYYFYLGWKHARPHGFLSGVPSRETMSSLLRLSIPAGFQQFFFAAGMMVFFWIIGQVGTPALSASQVLVSLLLVAILVGVGFGMASATLVGQALGRKELDEAEKWGWRVGRISFFIVILVAIPGLLFPDLLLGIFLKNPDTLAMARTPFRLIAGLIAFDNVGMVLLQSLLGAGASRIVMLVSVGLQWGVSLPLCYLFGPVWGYGLLGIWSVNVGYRLVQSVIFSMIWKRGSWKAIQV
jgi:putative MATE family efflux protein